MWAEEFCLAKGIQEYSSAFGPNLLCLNVQRQISALPFFCHIFLQTLETSLFTSAFTMSWIQGSKQESPGGGEMSQPASVKDPHLVYIRHNKKPHKWMKLKEIPTQPSQEKQRNITATMGIYPKNTNIRKSLEKWLLEVVAHLKNFYYMQINCLMVHFFRASINRILHFPLVLVSCIKERYNQLSLSSLSWNKYVPKTSEDLKT